MVAIEPILGFLGPTKDTNTHVAADIRNVLGQITDLGQRYATALGSNSPKGVNRALDSFMASSAQGHQMRGGYITIKEVDSEKRETGRNLLQPARPLTVGVMPPGFAYCLLGQMAGPCSESGKDVTAAYVHWEGPVTGSADEALRAAHFEAKCRGAQDGANEVASLRNG